MKLVRTGVAGLAALVLAACGSTTAGSGSATPTTAASSAPSASSSVASSASSSASSAASSASQGSSASSSATSGSGSADIDPVAGELVGTLVSSYAQVTSLHGTLTIDAGAAAGGAQNAVFDEALADGQATSLKMNYSAAGQTFDILFVDKRLFVGGAIAAQMGAGDKPWAELTESTTNALGKQMYATFLTSVESSGPSQYLDFLRLASNTTKVGSEQVNGVDTTKYTLDLDLTKLDSADVSETTKTSLGSAAKLGLTKVPCTFWIDSNGLMQQVTQQIDIQGQSVNTTIVFSKYNEPVDITAPDPSTVATV